jgi:hypothetical protein
MQTINVAQNYKYHNSFTVHFQIITDEGTSQDGYHRSNWYFVHKLGSVRLERDGFFLIPSYFIPVPVIFFRQPGIS